MLCVEEGETQDGESEAVTQEEREASIPGHTHRETEDAGEAQHQVTHGEQRGDIRKTGGGLSGVGGEGE